MRKIPDIAMKYAFKPYAPHPTHPRPQLPPGNAPLPEPRMWTISGDHNPPKISLRKSGTLYFGMITGNNHTPGRLQEPQENST